MRMGQTPIPELVSDPFDPSELRYELTAADWPHVERLVHRLVAKQNPYIIARLVVRDSLHEQLRVIGAKLLTPTTHRRAPRIVRGKRVLDARILAQHRIEVRHA